MILLGVALPEEEAKLNLEEIGSGLVVWKELDRRMTLKKGGKRRCEQVCTKYCAES